MRIAIVVVLLAAVAGVGFWLRTPRPLVTAVEPAPLPVKPPDKAKLLADAREQVTSAVKMGYETREQMIESGADLLTDGAEDPQATRTVTQMVDDALEAHRKQELAWTSVTDNDRLDRAFAELDKAGIVARQNFSDCGTCGVAEIGDEMEQAKKAGKRVRGYVFFHQQDTEGALDGGFYLNYGALDESERAQITIGREVATALTKAGLTVDWNGKLEARIGVTTFDWKKRRFSKAPPS